MEIKKEDLMTYNEFCDIIVSKFVKEIATTIGLKLKKSPFFRKTEKVKNFSKIDKFLQKSLIFSKKKS